MNILSIKNLSLNINGNKILDDINIEFWQGYIHTLVGPNGAGKSTLAYALMGLEGYTKIEGDIILEGNSIKDLGVAERAKRGITLAWQEPARYEGLTIENFMKAAAHDKSDKVLEDALLKVGLVPSIYLKRALDKTLSGGERKKIELASILIMKPKIVMLDEPDSGIDIASLDKIFEAIKLLKSQGSTVILITHSLAVLQQSEHAFLICHGHLIEKGTSRSISKYFKNKCLPCNHQNIPQEGGK